MSPVALPCLPVICSGIPGIPSVSDVVKGVIKTLADIFLGSIGDAIKSIIGIVVSSPDAQLNAPWFQMIYGDVFGLMLVFGFFTLIYQGFNFAVSRNKTDSAVAVFANLVKLFLFGTILPALVGLGVFAQQKLTSAAILLADAGGKNDWQQHLTHNYDIANLLGSIALRFYSLILAGALWLEISPLQLIVYLLTIFSLVAYTFGGTGKWAQRIRRWAFAAILSILLEKPVIAFTLVIAGRVINAIPQPDVFKSAEVAETLTFCFWIPLILFFASTYVVSHIQDGVNVHGNVFTSAEDEDPAQVQADVEALIAARNDSSNDTKDQKTGARDAGRHLFDEGAGWAAAAAASKVHPVAGVAVTAAHMWVKGNRKE